MTAGVAEVLRQAGLYVQQREPGTIVTPGVAENCLPLQDLIEVARNLFNFDAVRRENLTGDAMNRLCMRIPMRPVVRGPDQKAGL